MDKKIVWLPKDEIENENSELWQCFYGDIPSAYGIELDPEEIEEIKVTHHRIEIPVS